MEHCANCVAAAELDLLWEKTPATDTVHRANVRSDGFMRGSAWSSAAETPLRWARAWLNVEGLQRSLLFSSGVWLGMRHWPCDHN